MGAMTLMLLFGISVGVGSAAAQSGDDLGKATYPKKVGYV